MRRATRGFTLVETIAAIIVLAVGLPPILWAVRDAHVQRVGPVLASRARWLAVEKLEDVIADRHSTTRGWTYVDTSNYLPESAVDGFGAFRRRVIVTETGADLSSPGTGYKRIAVTVQWRDALGESRQRTVSTVLTDYTG